MYRIDRGNDLQMGFEDINELFKECKFSNCTHYGWAFLFGKASNF